MIYVRAFGLCGLAIFVFAQASSHIETYLPTYLATVHIEETSVPAACEVSLLQTDLRLVETAVHRPHRPETVSTATATQQPEASFSEAKASSTARTLAWAKARLGDRHPCSAIGVMVLLGVIAFCVALMIMSKGESNQEVAEGLQKKDPEVADRVISQVDLMEVHSYTGEVPSFWQDPFCRRDFETVVISRAAPRVFAAAVIYMVGLYINNVSQAWIHHKMTGYYEARWAPKSEEHGFILYDFGFSVLPQLTNLAIVQVWVFMASVAFWVRFIVLPGPFSMRWTILIRFWICWGLLWGLRALVIMSTALPNPEKACIAKIMYPDNIFWEALAMMGRYVCLTSENTCHDVLYSGHTVGLTLPILLWIRYDSWAPWLLRRNGMRPTELDGRSTLRNSALVLYMVVGCCLIVCSKYHYTCDVLVAFLLTVLIYHSYHSLVRIAFLPHHGAGSNIHKLVRWFEEHAADVALHNRLLGVLVPDGCRAVHKR